MRADIRFFSKAKLCVPTPTDSAACHQITGIDLVAVAGVTRLAPCSWRGEGLVQVDYIVFFVCGTLAVQVLETLKSAKRAVMQCRRSFLEKKTQELREFWQAGSSHTLSIRPAGFLSEIRKVR